MINFNSVFDGLISRLGCEMNQLTSMLLLLFDLTAVAAVTLYTTVP